MSGGSMAVEVYDGANAHDQIDTKYDMYCPLMAGSGHNNYFKKSCEARRNSKNFGSVCHKDCLKKYGYVKPERKKEPKPGKGYLRVLPYFENGLGIEDIVKETGKAYSTIRRYLSQYEKDQGTYKTPAEKLTIRNIERWCNGSKN